MPRRSRPRNEPAPAAEGADGSTTSLTPVNARSGFPPGRSSDRLESGPDGDWTVRTISGAGSAKTYRCPGCDHEIHSGTPHLVAWPANDTDAGDRRHWHRTCWRSRGRRNPGRSRW